MQSTISLLSAAAVVFPGHDSHCAAPAGDHRLAAQATHVAADVAVVEAEDVPAGHALQAPPEALAYHPAGQVDVHAAAPAAALVAPAQTVQAELPVPAANVPAGQAVHCVLPGAAAKVPAAQGVHVVQSPAAVTGAVRYEPGAQAEQEETLGFGKVPGAQ